MAGLLCHLWTGPPAGHPFRPLAGMCERWAGEFERRYAAARGLGSPELAAAREPWLVIDPKPHVATRPTTRCSIC